jgi:tetratricopeptide (TPR) repeat protein
MTRPARRLSATAILYLLSTTLVPSAFSQSPKQRASITAFRDSLGSVADVAALEQLRARARADRAGHAGRLRLGCILHRLGELTGRREPLDDAVVQFAEVARAEPDWPEGWYGMALAKLELHDQGFPAKEGPYQRSGSDYLHGAVDGFIKALDADPGFAAAAARLAPSVLRESVEPQHKEALAPLRRAARGPGASDSTIQLAHGLIEREAGDGSTALAAFDRFLQLGGDSAVGLLERARTLSLLGRPAEAQQAYSAAASRARSVAAVAHLRSDLAWIATREELAEFDATSATSRAAWLEAFWARKDAEEARAPGERLAEHYRRLAYVMRHFRLVSEKQQRATLSMIRSPQLASRSPTIEDRLRAMVRKLAFATQGKHAADPEVAVDRLGIPTDDLSELHARLNDQTLLRAYRSDQNVLDDRGVIYVRHGEPAERARYAGSDSDSNESWLYQTAAGPRIFHFIGLASPTTLVEQLPLNPELLASRGGLDLRYERMAADAGKYRLTPTLREEDRSIGRAAIAAGTTTDTYPLSFERDLAPIVQAVGVREGLAGQGQILVVFAAKGASLPSRKADADSRNVYPMRLRIIALGKEADTVYRMDTTRMFATDRILTGDEFLTGQAKLPVPAGTYQVRIVVGDERMQVGAAISLGSLTVPDLDAGKLTMSEPVLGRAGSGQLWISPSDTVPLNPLNAYPVRSTVEVYYQVGGIKPGRSYETTIEVRRRGKDDRVSAEFKEENLGPKIARSRTIALGKLPAGEYALTVTMKEVGGSASVTRRQSFNVTKE